MPPAKDVHILWTNDNLDSSRFMVMQYATNSMTYMLWDNVTVIIWGAPVKLAAQNETLQEEIKMAQHVGVKFSACQSCARRYELSDRLETQGIEVIPWVEPLTQLIQSGAPVIYV